MTAQSGSTQSDFALVPDEVSDAGRYVQQVAESLINGLTSLETDISALLSNWRGTSADSFNAGWTETKQGADTVLDALAEMSELLGVTSKTLDDQDKVRADTTVTFTGSLDLPGL
ncbi:WXG100 family type VII secretion target [Nocardia sp. XZ_19_385]|uniref:WXG100 family type VII secretion target n=1 Tax=Nocardia sp. XZ_19_385 TaxID=2769488 RepID=UPI00188E30F1|nr:WXG100 family type VII secretion target [Nocardia sp. XZ_19_385]